MQIVSFARKPAEESKLPQPKPLMMTAEAVAEVQQRGQAEYNSVINALVNLVNVMDATVLYKNLSMAIGTQLKEAFDTRLTMLDPALSMEKASPETLGKLKSAQREIFLQYSEKYHLDGIKRGQ